MKWDTNRAPPVSFHRIADNVDFRFWRRQLMEVAPAEETLLRLACCALTSGRFFSGRLLCRPLRAFCFSSTIVSCICRARLYLLRIFGTAAGGSGGSAFCVQVPGHDRMGERRSPCGGVQGWRRASSGRHLRARHPQSQPSPQVRCGNQ